MAKVTGIGGVFFKAKTDAKALAAWYEKHLGVSLEEWGGAILPWPADTAEDKGMTVWNLAAPDSDWFAPSEASFMINYRVDDLLTLLAQLAADGIEPIKGPEFHENGRFAWILDPDGNKIELWQPMLWDDKNKVPPETDSTLFGDGNRGGLSLSSKGNVGRTLKRIWASVGESCACVRRDMHKTNKERLLLFWALSATLAAATALAYIAGRASVAGSAPAKAAQTLSTSPALPETQVSQTRYVVPTEMQTMAGEWRSEAADSLVGYAVLFEPARRRFIAEKCEHHGYAPVHMKAREDALCITLLEGRLASLSTEEAIVVDRQRHQSTVPLAFTSKAGETTLRMTVGEHEFQLIEGNRNDLMQAFEALPQVKENKRAYLTARFAQRERPDEMRSVGGEVK
ncbi:MAG: VOC family protein [Pseudomonadota bacterium]